MSTPKRDIRRVLRNIATNLSSDSARKVGLPSHFSSSSKMLSEDTESGFDTSWLSKKIVSRSAGRQLFRIHRGKNMNIGQSGMSKSKSLRLSNPNIEEKILKKKTNKTEQKREN
jgi:hypothetical protein